MDFRDITRSALEEYRQHLNRALDGLTPVELRWQPSPSSNHILWLAWHIARVEDSWMNRYIAGDEQVWVSGRWCQRLRLPADRGGAGDTAEEVADFPDVDIAEVTGYHDEVRESALKVLDGLTEADLGASYPDRSRRRGGEPPTVSWVLGHVAVEEAQHVGQMAYVRGMLRGLGG